MTSMKNLLKVFLMCFIMKKVCKDGFWSMQNKAEFNAVASKLLSFRLFRLKYRSAAAKMDKAIPLYKAFLDSYVASREENTAEFEGEALNEQIGRAHV